MACSAHALVMCCVPNSMPWHPIFCRQQHWRRRWISWQQRASLCSRSCESARHGQQSWRRCWPSRGRGAWGGKGGGVGLLGAGWRAACVSSCGLVLLNPARRAGNSLSPLGQHNMLGYHSAAAVVLLSITCCRIPPAGTAARPHPYKTWCPACVQSCKKRSWRSCRWVWGLMGNLCLATCTYNQVGVVGAVLAAPSQGGLFVLVLCIVRQRAAACAATCAPS